MRNKYSTGSGSVEHEGKTLEFLHIPYPNTICNLRIRDTVETINGNVWQVEAKDEDGNEYMVYWTALKSDGEPQDWSRCTVIAG